MRGTYGVYYTPTCIEADNAEMDANQRELSFCILLCVFVAWSAPKFMR